MIFEILQLMIFEDLLHDFVGDLSLHEVVPFNMTKN